MNFEPIKWDGKTLTILDQRLLPVEEKYITLENEEEVFDAIKTLAVRGAPLIGVSAALGMAVCMKNNPGADWAGFEKRFFEVCDYIESSRPTAVNLSWALNRLRQCVGGLEEKTVQNGVGAIEALAVEIFEEDKKLCRAIGANGHEIIKDGDCVLTHCNAGGLATSGYGTALAVIFSAFENGKKFSVFADETRPLLQGARLTSWELVKSGIDCTLICDNMAGFLMKQGRVDKIVVGADRIAANGDTANKIGTYSVARLAAVHNVPFYIAAPYSTIDFDIQTGDQIPIEERTPDEVKNFGARPTAPEGVKVYNPAFDVTPSEFISGIITEKGIIRAPYAENIKKLYSQD